MKLRKRTIFFAILIVGIAGLIYRSYTAANAPKKVQVVEATKNNLQVVVSASGKIQSQKTYDLFFTSSGRISYLPFQEGDHVEKGQVLAYLDGTLVKEQENQAWANYRLALEKLREFENGRKDKPKDDTYLISKAQLEAQRDSSSALVGQTLVGYRDKTLISPLSGTIAKINAKVGETTSSVPVITVIDESSLEFVAEIDEQDIGTITPNLPTEIFLDAFSGKTFTGTVSKIESIAKTGSTGNTYYPVKISLVTPASQLLIGMSGDADIKTAEKQDVLTVPLDVINEENDQKFVYIVENSIVKKQDIRTGLASDLDVEIVEGLTAGQKVITSDVTLLKKGMAVEITKE